MSKNPTPLFSKRRLSLKVFIKTKELSYVDLKELIKELLKEV